MIYEVTCAPFAVSTTKTLFAVKGELGYAYRVIEAHVENTDQIVYEPLDIAMQRVTDWGSTAGTVDLRELVETAIPAPQFDPYAFFNCGTAPTSFDSGFVKRGASSNRAGWHYEPRRFEDCLLYVPIVAIASEIGGIAINLLTAPTNPHTVAVTVLLAEMKG